MCWLPFQVKTATLPVSPAGSGLRETARPAAAELTWPNIAQVEVAGVLPGASAQGRAVAGRLA